MSAALQSILSEIDVTCFANIEDDDINVNILLLTRHLHYIWKTNTTAWFHVGNKFLQDRLWMTSLCVSNLLSVGQHRGFFFSNWRALKRTYHFNTLFELIYWTLPMKLALGDYHKSVLLQEMPLDGQTKRLPEPMLTQMSVAIWYHLSTMMIA